MTRSKIQKLKFFIFLLIFLLAQTAVCHGSFREKRNVPSTDERHGDKDGQRNAAGSAADARKPALEANKTHDGITSKPLPPDVTVANKTDAHTADTSNEVSWCLRHVETEWPSFL